MYGFGADELPDCLLVLDIRTSAYLGRCGGCFLFVLLSLSSRYRAAVSLLCL
jgi:hypothetical protein